MESNEDASSDSDYAVEHFVRPDRIRRAINDDSADILGNFDDEKRKEVLEGINLRDYDGESRNKTDTESEEEEVMDGENEEVPENEDNNEEDEAAAIKGKSSKMLTKGQMEVLLRGIAKANRHVLYVTNLNFETTKEDLFQHFEAAGNVKSVRMPKKHRGGCAFIEFTDMESYQRGFTLHNSELKGRQIKVQYSEAGKKKSANKKNIIKQKNRKLAQMRNELKTFTKSGKFYDKNLKKEKAVEALARKRWRKKPAPRND